MSPRGWREKSEGNSGQWSGLRLGQFRKTLRADVPRALPSFSTVLRAGTHPAGPFPEQSIVSRGPKMEDVQARGPRPGPHAPPEAGPLCSCPVSPLRPRTSPLLSRPLGCGRCSAEPPGRHLHVLPPPSPPGSSGHATLPLSAPGASAVQDMPSRSS